MSDTSFDDPGKFWDDKFDQPDYRYGRTPNAFLAQTLPSLLEPGQSVLCVGDGEGRNGVWCAEQGFDTTSLEPSKVGTEKIAALANERGVDLTIIHDRMTDQAVDDQSFDAVVLTFIHTPPPIRKPLHQACINALRPGGVIVLEAFTPEQITNHRPSGGPPTQALMFTPDILREDFAALTIEILTEETVQLDEGPGHRGPADVVRLVARRT